MKRFKHILALTMLLTITSLGWAQIIADVELTNAVDSKTISLSKLSSKNVVVIFFSNNCPFDKYYLDRIKSMEAE